MDELQNPKKMIAYLLRLKKRMKRAEEEWTDLTEELQALNIGYWTSWAADISFPWDYDKFEGIDLLIDSIREAHNLKLKD